MYAWEYDSKKRPAPDEPREVNPFTEDASDDDEDEMRVRQIKKAGRTQTRLQVSVFKTY